MDIETLKKEVKIETLRSGKPGGQRRDKTETKVRITHLPSGIRAIGDEGSQEASKKVAFKTLIEKLERYFRPRKPRYKTKPPLRAKLERLKEKKIRKEKKQLRRKPTIE